jgi:hypothetical protein
MKYMLPLRTPAVGGPQEGTPELADEMRAWRALNEELEAADALITVYDLELDDAATTLRIRPLSAVSQSS